MKRVIIVDDAIDLARMMQDALKVEHPDIPITVVPSAEEALLESTRLTFDLLVTDLRLPGMSGLELIRKIRVRQPQIKVILITAVVMDERLTQQKDEVGPEVFMRKPVSISVFLETAQKLIFGDTPPEKAGAQADADEPAPVPARKTTGRLTMPLMATQPEERSLSAALSRIRGSFGALAALLLDENGRQVAQAGDLPGVTPQEKLIPPLMASISAGARVSYLLGLPEVDGVQAYRGSEFDLVLSPVGQYTLLVALKNDRSSLRLALAFEEAGHAQANLREALESMGLRVKSVAEVGAPETILAEMGVAAAPEQESIPPEIRETPLGQDPDLEKFQELFSRKKTGELPLQDADDFWNSAGNSDNSTTISSSGVLTFEQAQKLGLVPPAEDKK